jgi:biopolymer transport protein TolR
MAFGRLERTAQPTPMSEINMTPLIDVMLVLLVIFMVAAPLMASSLKLDLPASDAATPTDTPDFIAVAVTADGKLHLDQQPIEAEAFAKHVADAARRNPNTEVQLRADKAVPYGRVAELIATVQQAGLNRIGFVTAPASPGAP